MRPQRLVLALLVAATLAAPTVRADDLATAQQLFRQGRSLMSEGKVAEACGKFEGAAQLSPTAGVRLNLAECWAKLGRIASAWAKYEEAQTLAERAGDAAAAQIARDRRVELEPRLSFLTIAVPPEAVVEGLEISRDGQRLPPAAWNTPVPVDPGDHMVVARAPRRKPWSERPSVAGAGVKLNVVVPVLEFDPGATATGLPPDDPSEPPPVGTDVGTQGSRGDTQRTIALVSGGIGVIGLGVGTYFGLRAMAKKDEYEEHRGADGRCLDMDCQNSSEDAHAAGNLSTVGFVAGGAFLAAGAVLWLTAPAGGAKTTSTRIGPAASPQMAGLEMRGTW
ncbi:MAG: hypothetical protein CVU63_12165 [Deltaproteobacteria bacterium HGW-Deltaproteobacteria-20]|jgi:hypothetical protein|nr:MAG: hypothetical protein CVU63_12165 [Deltaproteobacteria bacterium HGW-Deltaproteobacteria-20]